MNEELIQRLMGKFVEELEENVRVLNDDLIDLEKEPGRKDLHKALFRVAHSLKGAARSVNVEPVEGVCHRLEGILSTIREGQLLLDSQLFQLLFAAVDAISDAGRQLRAHQGLDGTRLSRLQELLEAAAEGRSISTTPELANEWSADEQDAESPQKHEATVAASSADPDSSVVRVHSRKLDGLFARSGELLVSARRLEARTDDLAAISNDLERWKSEWSKHEKRTRGLVDPPETAAPGGQGRAAGTRQERSDGLKDQVSEFLCSGAQTLVRLRESLDRTVTELAKDARLLLQNAGALDQDVRRVRMLPFAEACQGFERTARDLAKSGGKEVDLVLEGGDVEMDRGILESLKAPLLQMLRNAIDHGLESPADRRAADKPPRGKIVVSALLKDGSTVQVSVADDGRGLDLEAIRQQAEKGGLAVPSSDEETARLVFQPSLSTAGKITEISGRGVGLDVVAEDVDAIHGSYDVSSQSGKGTRFTLLVPLTLTKIRSLIVHAGNQVFAFPSTNVRRLMRLERSEIRSLEGREVIAHGAKLIPVVSLPAVLGMPRSTLASPNEKLQVVVIATGEQQLGVAVDRLVAEHDVLVKSLGRRIKRVRNITGVTILPDGRLALILNVPDLLRAPLRSTSGDLTASIVDSTPAVKKRLIVVDDSVTTRTLVQSILEAAGYETISAADGADAWQILQSQEVDLVFSDIEMPRMTGYELTEKIRGSSRFRNTPVVLCTSLEAEDDRRRGMEVGANAYLVKNGFDQGSFLEVIEQLL